jgi:hypothetical protein
MAFTVYQTIYSYNFELYNDNELERIWKEIFVVKFKLSPSGTEKTHKGKGKVVPMLS